MKKTLSLTVLAALALPLLAAVPASRLKEPNAVFAFDVDPAANRFTAVLFDRAKRRALEHADARVDYPPYGIGGNDAIQFAPATKKIYVGSVETGTGTRILEGGFDWKDPAEIFSCRGCRVTGWLVHPTRAAVYVAVEDPFSDDEFRNAKLAEITLAPVRRTRVIGRIPARASLGITPDGSEVYAFGTAEHSDFPYGELVRIRIADRHRVKMVVNFPREDTFGNPVADPSTENVSPDARELVYPNVVVDVRTDKEDEVLETGPYVAMNGTIGWSRDSRKLLFPVVQQGGQGTDPEEAMIVVDRKTKTNWTLPLLDAGFLDWAPAQTAILFLHGNDVEFYDLEKREWVHVLDGGRDHVAGGSWLTLPTKRVRKR